MKAVREEEVKLRGRICETGIKQWSFDYHVVLRIFNLMSDIACFYFSIWYSTLCLNKYDRHFGCNLNKNSPTNRIFRTVAQQLKRYSA